MIKLVIKIRTLVTLLTVTRDGLNTKRTDSVRYCTLFNLYSLLLCGLEPTLMIDPYATAVGCTQLIQHFSKTLKDIATIF